MQIIFKNFLDLCENDLNLEFYKSDDKTFLHYRSDLGFDYNPLLGYDLHQGHDYASINKVDSGYMISAYRVQHYPSFVNVWNGKKIIVEANKPLEYYNKKYKETFGDLMIKVQKDKSRIIHKKNDQEL